MPRAWRSSSLRCAAGARALRGYRRTDRVAPTVFGARAAASAPVEPGERIEPADFELFAEDIAVAHHASCRPLALRRNASTEPLSRARVFRTGGKRSIPGDAKEAWRWKHRFLHPGTAAKSSGEPATLTEADLEHLRAQVLAADRRIDRPRALGVRTHQSGERRQLRSEDPRQLAALRAGSGDGWTRLGAVCECPAAPRAGDAA